jgi:type IV pilus assembly protein PilA
MNMAAEVKVGVADYWAARGTLPASNAAAGIAANATNLQGNYVSSINVTNGRIDIQYGLRANGNVSGSVLSIRPLQNTAGSLVWVCGTAASPGSSTTPTGGLSDATTVLGKFLPTDCRS